MYPPTQMQLMANKAGTWLSYDISDKRNPWHATANMHRKKCRELFAIYCRLYENGRRKNVQKRAYNAYVRATRLLARALRQYRKYQTKIRCAKQGMTYMRNIPYYTRFADEILSCTDGYIKTRPLDDVL